MKRVLVLVEGQTEETFVSKLLAPWLWPFQVDLRATQVATRRVQKRRQYRGGHGRKYAHIQKDVRRLLGDPHAAVTTLLDYYGLPPDFPGMPPPGRDSFERADALEAAFAADINDPRFLPNLIVHEFETLVFAGPSEAAEVLQQPQAGDAMRRIVGAFGTPERINDLPATCPSRRLAALAPQYRKAFHGPLILQRIGLAAARMACPRFDAWVRRLESLGTPPGDAPLAATT